MGTVPRGRLPARRRLEDSATRFWVGNWELANAGEEGQLLLQKGLIKGSHTVLCSQTGMGITRAV